MGKIPAQWQTEPICQAGASAEKVDKPDQVKGQKNKRVNFEPTVDCDPTLGIFQGSLVKIHADHPVFTTAAHLY
ncbi:MAG: hypothetical protein WAK96_14195 [Desulfobaccales bacterium]